MNFSESMSVDVSNMIEWPTQEVMIGRDKILTFKQMEGERIHQSWAILKGLITQCSYNDFHDMILIYLFRGISRGIKGLYYKKIYLGSHM